MRFAVCARRQDRSTDREPDVTTIRVSSGAITINAASLLVPKWGSGGAQAGAGTDVKTSPRCFLGAVRLCPSTTCCK